MFASDFVKLYALVTRIANMSITEVTPETFGRLQADAIVSKIAIDICVLPKIQNVEILNEISIGKQSTNANVPAGNDGVSV